MGLRYIGSKARVANDILDVLGAPHSTVGNAGGCLLRHRLRGGRRGRSRLERPAERHVVQLGGDGRREARLPRRRPLRQHWAATRAAIDDLNALAGRPGFVAEQYSPLSVEIAGVERRYFTVDNAAAHRRDPRRGSPAGIAMGC